MKVKYIQHALVLTHVECKGGEYHSGVNTDTVVTCTEIYITDGGKITCKPEYIVNVDTEQGNVKTTKTTDVLLFLNKEMIRFYVVVTT